MFQHRVDDGQQFAHDGDQRDVRGFAGEAQQLVVGTQRQIMPSRGHGAHVQHRADRAAPASAIAIERRHADERGNRPAIELAPLGKFGQQGARDDRPNPRDTAQQILMHAPERTAFDRVADIVVAVADAAFEPRDVLTQTAADRRRRGRRKPLAFRRQQVEQLAPASH